MKRKRRPFPIGLTEAQAEAEFIRKWNADTFDDLCVLYAGLTKEDRETLVQSVLPWWNSLRDLEEKIAV